MKLPPVVVSRVDRIGDLILSLPVLGYLKQLGFEDRVLHVDRYCKDIAWWAQYNGLCNDVWVMGEEAPAFAVPPLALSLLYSPQAIQDLRRVRPQCLLGPRTKLSALWNLTKSIPQHRSKVEKSEMAYNVDLARDLAHFVGLRNLPEFKGLEALRIPGKWIASLGDLQSPDLCLVVSNRGSAGNWPIENYIELALRARKEGKSVDFLVSGLDATSRMESLKNARVEASGCRILGDFSSLSQLIAYLARCRQVLCSSTGPLHIAHAAGVSVVGIYPTLKVQSFERWRPDGYWHAAPIRLIEIESNT